MDKKLLLLTAITTIGFSLWPILARKSGLPQAWILFTLGVALMVASGITALMFPKQALEYRTGSYELASAFIILILAVFLNAGGSVSFTGITTSPSPYALGYVAVVMAMVPVMNKIAAPLVDKTAEITPVNIIGMFGVVISILLVTYKKV